MLERVARNTAAAKLAELVAERGGGDVMMPLVPPAAGAAGAAAGVLSPATLTATATVTAMATAAVTSVAAREADTLSAFGPTQVPFPTQLKRLRDTLERTANDYQRVRQAPKCNYIIIIPNPRDPSI